MKKGRTRPGEKSPVLIDNSEARKKVRAAKRRRRIAFLLLALVALLLGIFRNDIDLYRIRQWLSGEKPEKATRFAVDLDTGGSLAFGASRDCLALCNGSSLGVYRQDGSRKLNVSVSLGTPAMETAGGYVLAYDRGGVNAYLTGGVALSCSVRAQGAMLCADVGEDGTFALVSSSEQSLSVLEVFNHYGKKKYGFVSSSSYITGVAIGDDGKNLAIAGFSADRMQLSGLLRFLSVSSEQPVAEVSLPDELILKIHSEGDTLLVLTDRALHSYSLSSGALLGETSFGGQKLLYCSLNPPALVLGRYAASHENAMLCCDSKAAQVSSVTLTEDIRAIYGGYDRLLLLGETALLYDKAGNLLAEQPQSAGVRGGVILKGGTAALIDSSGVTLLS
ncbi:MAG: hypothetical protein IJL15_06395 [Clostridia bacterium]|nr:hypothetical protein [Clostridia bacterium]